MRIAKVCLLVVLFALPLFAQTDAKPESKPESRGAQVYAGLDPATRPAPLGQQVVKTFYLNYATEPARVQDLVNAMRTILEFQRVQPVPAIHAVVVRGNPEQVAAAEKLVRDIDKPGATAATSESYKLDYTLSEVESGKKVSSKTYSVVVKRGRDQHDAEYSKYRVGSRVPFSTGPQVQYNDIGVSIDCRLFGDDETLTLDSTVEVSGVANPQDTTGHPTIRQSKSSSVATLTPGKPLLIASLDGADSPRKTEIEVTATRLK